MSLMRIIALACSLFALPAEAQLADLLAQDQALGNAIRGLNNGIIQQNMQSPYIAQLYQQHLAQGGRMSFQQFAYAYAATGGFSAQGIANYRDSENANMARERNAWQGLLDAQANRAEAQRQYMEGYSRNSREAGNMLGGNNTYYNPNTGSQILSHMTPNQPVQDPASGNVYVMDNNGQYYVRLPNGQWQGMSWAR